MHILKFFIFFKKNFFFPFSLPLAFCLVFPLTINDYVLAQTNEELKRQQLIDDIYRKKNLEQKKLQNRRAQNRLLYVGKNIDEDVLIFENPLYGQRGEILKVDIFVHLKSSKIDQELTDFLMSNDISLAVPNDSELANEETPIRATEVSHLTLKYQTFNKEVYRCLKNNLLANYAIIRNNFPLKKTSGENFFDEELGLSLENISQYGVDALSTIETRAIARDTIHVLSRFSKRLEEKISLESYAYFKTADILVLVYAWRKQSFQDKSPLPVTLRPTFELMPLFIDIAQAFRSRAGSVTRERDFVLDKAKGQIPFAQKIDFHLLKSNSFEITHTQLLLNGQKIKKTLSGTPPVYNC